MSRKAKRDSPPSFATAKDGHEHFTPLYDSMLNSPAYICLNTVAKVLYLILRQEYKGIFTGNKVICSYDTIVKKGISRNSIASNLCQLEAFGFISYQNGGLARQPNVFSFSEGWKKIQAKEEAREIKKRLAKKQAEMNRRNMIFKQKTQDR